jgi:hypothetical protein
MNNFDRVLKILQEDNYVNKYAFRIVAPIKKPNMSFNRTYKAWDAKRSIGTKTAWDDIKSVAEWVDATEDEVRFNYDAIFPLKNIEKDILEMIDSYEEFPIDYRRTKRIIKEIQKTGWVEPLYIKKDDPNFFVMEGRHRMVAFYMLGMRQVPVLYVSVVK